MKIDPAPSPQPRSSYFVCFTPRTGSTLLCEALIRTGVAGCPEDYLPDDDFGVTAGAAVTEPVWNLDWDAHPFRECLNNVLKYGTTPNGVFGTKMKTSNLKYLRRVFGQEPALRDLPFPQQLAETFPDPRYIWITRRDKLAQAVSFLKACQSQVWISTADGEPHSRPYAFKFEQLDSCLRLILRWEKEWAEYFSASGIIPFTVVYEDLVADYEQVVRGVLKRLQTELPDGYQFPAPRLQRQADTVSEEWIRRYRKIESQRLNWQWVPTQLLKNPPAGRRPLAKSAIRRLQRTLAR